MVSTKESFFLFIFFSVLKANLKHDLKHDLKIKSQKKSERILRCGDCIYFSKPSDNGKWGWCIFRKCQRSKYQKFCKVYRKK